MRSRLLVMHTPPQVGWEDFIGTYWVLMSDGKRIRHTTERQTEVTLTLKPGQPYSVYFREATDG